MTKKQKTIFWVGALLLSPIALFLVLAILLYIPPIQNWAVHKIATYASKNTGYNVSIDYVRLAFPLDLSVNGLTMTQASPKDESADTITYAKQLFVSVELLPLLQSKVEIDKLDFQDVHLNTADFIKSARIKGSVGRLFLQSHGIDLRNEHLTLNKASLSKANIDVALSDTVPEDTTKTPTYWKIDVRQLDIAQSHALLHMPGDTLNVETSIGKLGIAGGLFDLGKNDYTLRTLTWKDSSVKYDNRFEKPVNGLDYNHISLTSLETRIDSVRYADGRLQMVVKDCKFQEKSGFGIQALQTKISLDSVHIDIPQFLVKTSESQIRAEVAMDFNTFASENPGKMSVNIDGWFGKQDIARLVTDKSLIRHWPNYPLSVKSLIKGNMKRAHIVGFQIKLPTAFDFSAKGFVANADKMERLRADIDFKGDTYNMRFLSAMLPKEIASAFSIPNRISINGEVHTNGPKYAVAANVIEGKGILTATGDIDTKSMKYKALIAARNVQLQHFLPNYGLSPFSGTIEAEGCGTDLLSPATKMNVNASISSFKYSNYTLDGTKLSANVKNGIGHCKLDSHNPLLDGLIEVNALMSKKQLKGTLSCDLKKADLYGLCLTKKPLTVSLRSQVNVASNLTNAHEVRGQICDIYLKDSCRTYHPENISLNAFTRKDSTHASIESGDFSMRMDAHGYYEHLLTACDRLGKEVLKQKEDRYINQQRLRAILPYASLEVNTGKENMICRALNYWGYEIEHAKIQMETSPVKGINGDMQVNALSTSGIKLDTLRFAVHSDSTNTFFSGQIRNNKKNPQYVFNAMFGGTFYERGIYFGTRVFDDKDKLGIALGLSASMADNGIQLSLGKKNPILGYKEFSVNDDNYILLRRDNHLSANLSLLANDGMGVQVYTNDSTDALQDLTIGLHRFDLAKVLSVIPYTPQMAGEMSGDFHVIQTTEELSVSSSVAIDDLVYEHCPMGNVSTEFVYMPKEDGTHYVDGNLACNGYEVGALRGTYNPAGKGNLSADLTLTHTPLLLLNGFIPDRLFGFKGYAEGTLSVEGALDKPNVNGELYLDSAYIASEPYGVEMRFADDPVIISNSHLVFENFEIYSHNESPLNVSGYFDFSDMDNMYLDTKMRATNYLLIDSKENNRSETYGKAYVNFFGMMRGPVSALKMRGKLDVLGSTDMTYILRDSPLTTDNQLDELVKFVDFKDTKEQVVTRPPLTGFDMDLTVEIDEGAHILCALNTDHSNYIDLIGGGSLRMQYNTTDNILIRGRYTLSNGEMKYSLPVIPLKTFTIQDGSYVEFNGDPMNPTLNITATEQNKANVSTGGTEKTVLFECGVAITQTLNDMGLQFIIDAPEDMSIHNELQTMSKENRGKIAVSMLTTGMYLASGNTSSFSMNSALSAFLNSQINAISGNALRTLDLSFGMENSTTGTGQTHTDYSFKFAKRFWNNRLRIVIGGKVSSGAEVQNQNDTFFDNVTFEYRLSQNSNKYLKLFYERDSYDWLEGNVQEYGGGFIWRRKLQHFKDIFRFKSDKDEIVPAANKNDSTKTTK